MAIDSAGLVDGTRIADTRIANTRATRTGIVLSVAASLLLGACAQSQDGAMNTSLLGQPSTGDAATDVASANPNDTRSDLEKATDYWGKKYREKPTNKENALSYAKNLRAMGEKRQALAVLQQASIFYASDREVASEYGRLALEFDQVGIAKQMLATADDPGNPDWRVISARGTVFAKEGKFNDAVPLYERALTLAPTETSVMNNLALAYAMGGEPQRAEELLRRIEASGGTPNPKVKQNLALVLGLQGRFDESKAIASQEIGTEGAQANANLLRQFVKASAVPGPAAPAVAGWSATATEVKKSAPGKGKAKKVAAPAGDAYAPSTATAAPELGTDSVSVEADAQNPKLRGMTPQ